MKKFLLILGLMSISKIGWCLTPQPVVIAPSVSISSVGISGAQAQITITTAPGSGYNSTGWYNYLTNIHIEMYAVGTLTGGATPVTCTTTGLPTAVAFKFPTAAATGTNTVTDIQFANPLQGTAGTNVVITCPATASVIWNMQVMYFSGS